MLGRLLSGASAMRLGTGLMRKGMAMRKAQGSNRVAKTAAIIDSVRSKTRGFDHAKTKALFSKHTGAGRNRRLQAAALIKGKRAGLPGGHTHASYAAAQSKVAAAASRARSKAIVSNVKGVTRSILPASHIQKGGKSIIDAKSRQINRTHLAGFLRQARKGPTQGYYNRAHETFDFRKKRKFQGPTI